MLVSLREAGTFVTILPGIQVSHATMDSETMTANHSWLIRLSSLCVLCVLCGESCLANPPKASFIFPAGGRRGTTVSVRVGGLYLYKTCSFELLGPGVEASRQLHSIRTIWFEGPLLPLPASQQPEDYPRDMGGEVRIAADAPLGPRHGRLWTAEGAASGLQFVVGDLPEVVEQEIDGDPVPVDVTLPVTINGRIFPREDVDSWAFTARKGQTITAEVQAGRLGSPLDARLEVLDAEGRRLTENDDAFGVDPRVRFTAPADGKYQVRIRDANLGGGPAHVYRLTLNSAAMVDSVYPLGGRRGQKVRFTLSGPGVPADPVEVILPASAPPQYSHSFSLPGQTSRPVRLDVDDLPEHLESEPNEQPGQARQIEWPAVLNGRIDRPGDVDTWSFNARKGETIACELRAAQLGSPLQGVLAVVDAKDKVLAEAQAAAGQADQTISFTAPADGTYRVRVADRFRNHGGPDFSYRLRLAAPRPGFRLHLATDALTLPRGGQARLKVLVTRMGGFNGPIALRLEGLPAEVKSAATTIAAGQSAVEVTLTATATTPITTTRLRVLGMAEVEGKSVTETAVLQQPPGAPAVDSVLLAVGLKAPFKVVGAYDLRLAPRGSLFRRRYKIERNGFDGPLEIRLADHQTRHLQGVTGPTITVPAGVNEFEYGVQLPPWMETGRTSRSCILATGTIKEGDREYTVGYTSEAQNDQIIAVVETGRLGLDLEKTSVAAAPGGQVSVPVRVSRGKGLAGPVRLELILPEHVLGVSAEAVTIPAGESRAALTLRFAAGPLGPFNMPVVLRATLADPAGPVVAEAKVEIVAGP
jgi:hypothetical protein